MTLGGDLVALALSDADALRQWPPARCATLLRQARAAGLLGRLGHRDSGTDPRWPEAAIGHIEAAKRVTRAQQSEIRREVRHIEHALAPLGAPVVLLKGAAYVMAELPAASGRVFSDVDILVPKSALGAAESLLTLSGWMTTHHNAYDQRYYREWMHELPPMEHVHRKTTIDVHHTILPETARLRPSAARLLQAAMPLPGHSGLHVLAPVDMVLHSMTHLFMNDDMSHALRDLSDLDLLLRHFGGEESFWPSLVPRAIELDLVRPLFYGLRYTHRLLRTPVPATVSAALAGLAPPAPLRPLMDWIWIRALRSPHRSAHVFGRDQALFALYVRGHWLRMPPRLLAHHLATKALRRHERQPRSPDGDPQAPAP